MTDTEMGYRRRQAAATRAAVARAARQLFADMGYTATTIEKISARAGIPQQTIYSALGSKAAILEEVRRQWIDEADVARLHEAAMAVAEPGERLRRAAHWTRRQFELGSDVIAVHQQAALVDPRVGETWQAALLGRERAVRQLLEGIDAHRPGGPESASAVDLYIALTVPEIYRVLVTERGWSPDRYESWLGAALVSNLLGSDPRSGP